MRVGISLIYGSSAHACWKPCQFFLEMIYFFETMKKFHKKKSGVCRHFSTNQVSGHHSSLLLVGSSIFSPQKMRQISQMARPGVAPVEYTDGARVEMKVNKPSSQLPAPSSSQILFVFMKTEICLDCLD